MGVSGEQSDIARADPSENEVDGRRSRYRPSKILTATTERSDDISSVFTNIPDCRRYDQPFERQVTILGLSLDCRSHGESPVPVESCVRAQAGTQDNLACCSAPRTVHIRWIRRIRKCRG